MAAEAAAMGSDEEASNIQHGKSLVPCHLKCCSYVQGWEIDSSVNTSTPEDEDQEEEPPVVEAAE